MEEPEEAIALAGLAGETFAYLDIPHRTLDDIAIRFDDFGDPAQALLNGPMPAKAKHVLKF